MPSATSSTPPPRRGRPPSERKRAAVLEAATEVFLREGFAGTSVDVVAAEAGVAKQTVYSHFGGKEALFLEVLHAARTGGRPGGTPPRLGWVDAVDLPGVLVEFGASHLALTLSPRVAALRRLMIAELARRPELREMWNRGGPNQLFDLLGAEFSALDQAGRLRVPDPARAVAQYIALLAHEGNMRSLYGVHELTDADRRDIAAQAADMIVRAYRPEG
ncbi:MAG: TetR/AcrR family transcriptional regulator [Pseudonocardia sp.]|nr:TetR/AcrR family transcriptional regulator [Pseudonocardia sp.]